MTSLARATVNRRVNADPVSQAALDIAHIVDEILNSNMSAREHFAATANVDPFALVLPADARCVVEAASTEYLRLFPRSEHFARRKHVPWYNEWYLDSAPHEPGHAAEHAGTWMFRCKFCHEELAQIGVNRGERQLRRAFCVKLDEHGLRCAVALLLWVERRPTIPPGEHEDPCPARRQPRKSKRRR